jgi:hypothetical protein
MDDMKGRDCKKMVGRADIQKSDCTTNCVFYKQGVILDGWDI